MAEGKAKRPPVDWERIEIDYRAGVLSLAEIGKVYGVTKGRISQVASRDGWERDLSAKIAARVEAKLNKAAVNGELNEAKAFTERQVVEAGAQAIAAVRIAHRTDIGRARALVLHLLSELEAQTEGIEDFKALGVLLRSEDEKGVDRLNDAYQKALSLSGRISNIKVLSDALKNLIGLEADAWGLNAKNPAADADDARMGDVEAANRIAFLIEQARTK